MICLGAQRPQAGDSLSFERIIRLNVGGQSFITTTATLTAPAATGSLLAQLPVLQIAPQAVDKDGALLKRASVAADKAGMSEDVFIDRDGSLFPYISNYLRVGEKVVLPPDLHTTKQLLQEARYYELTGLVKLLVKQRDTLTKDAQAANRPPLSAEDLAAGLKSAWVAPADQLASIDGRVSAIVQSLVDMGYGPST